LAKRQASGGLPADEMLSEIAWFLLDVFFEKV